MKKIGVLSDTHGKLREEVVEILQECDVILHAGDINTPRVVESLREIAPLYVVRGNADKDWAADLPEQLSEQICGLRIFMVHNKKEIPGDTAGYDLIIYGHSHKYEEKETEECFFLNPGSCGPRRFSQPVTMAVVEVEEESGKFHVIKQDIRQSEEVSGKEKTPETVFSERTLSAILRDVDRGKSVSEIAGKYKIDPESVSQICRLYLTHPGISAAGVREKMGLPRNR
ncbi:MAG: YfcE family phosphodiesterase [Lachnospiraceae bacterium]|nr:YfcE family phosphodiesterase [Lachnospiraceae bacterium]